MKKSSEQKILLMLGHVLDELTTENRLDRLKALERENQLLRGGQEDTDNRMRALENYLGVEFIRESKYRKR